MVLGAGYTRPQNNQALKQCSMHLEIEKIRKDHSDLCGFQGLIQHQGIQEFRIPSL